jgi:glycosyltransferase involved in cell wall biosynthesis
VPPDDSAALAAAIVELHDDADKRARFAQAARRHVLRHFTAQRATSELIAVWEEVLSSPST